MIIVINIICIVTIIVMIIIFIVTIIIIILIMVIIIIFIVTIIITIFSHHSDDYNLFIDLPANEAKELQWDFTCSPLIKKDSC